MNTLKTEHVTFSYDNKVDILHDVNFTINSNEIIGLWGDSGSGKSTLCKILTGFINNYTGSVKINDEDIVSNFNPVQLIFQHPEKVMNPRWNMREILGESWMPNDNILDEFGVKSEWFNRFPSELSGGELQRFSILRALNPETKFIIADEITTMLDAVTQVQIWHSLLNVVKKREIGLLVVSHDKVLLNRVTDKIIPLDELNN